MIVFEERLKEIFDLLPNIQVNPSNSIKPSFSWGKKEELNRYIMKNKSASYPLIWLLPSVDTYNLLSDRVTRNVVLIVASLETRTELYNEQRYKGNFETVLNPLANYILQGLQGSSISRITNPNDISILKEPNYSDAGENATIDKWDALRIECNVEINNNCLNLIKWR